MKWLSNRSASFLALFAIAASIGLQLVWLRQLYKMQAPIVDYDLETAVGDAANMSEYLSIADGDRKEGNFKDFFLSSEWLQFKQAYGRVRFKNMTSLFGAEIRDDSTYVDLQLRFFNGTVQRMMHRDMKELNRARYTPEAIRLDREEGARLDSLVEQRLKEFGVRFAHQALFYDFNNGQLLTPVDTALLRRAGGTQQYTYNQRYLRTYQLLVPSITRIVLYRMRYYLLSSFIMVVLTVAVFYLLLRLMHNQRLYSDAKLSFTSNMTHELKTPVATVAIALETVLKNERGRLAGQNRAYLETSQRELNRLSLMIDKVLSLDRMDSAQDRLRKELFDVQDSLAAVMASMQLQVDSVKGRLHYVPSASPCFVEGDPVHISNVFFNLIENAIKYTGPGLVLNVRCTCARNEAVISFQDNGPGIAPAHQQHVFERFYRIPLGAGNIHNIKGTGLGLHYARQVLAKHGGRLQLVSAVGKGSLFTVHLPLAA